MFGSAPAAGGKKFDSQQYRDKYDKLAQQYADLMKTQTEKMNDYEKMSKDALHSLISQSAPAAAQMYSEATGAGDIYKNQGLPAYKKYISDAMNYDTPERRAAARQGAMADVDSATSAARNDALARLESYGIDPSQTRAGALDANITVNAALQKVAAAKTAEQQVEDTGHQYMTDALSAAGQLNSEQVALNNAATQTNTNAVSAANVTATNYGNIFGTPKNLLDSQTNINASQAALKQAEQASKGGGGNQAAQIGQGLGTVVGTAVGAYYGGPAGASAGGAAGGAVGGQVGGMAG